MNVMSYGLFVEILRVSLGLQDKLSVDPSDNDWKALYALAQKQTLMGVVFNGIERLPQTQRPPQEVLSRWIANVIHVEQANRHLDMRLKDLYDVCCKQSLQCCLLKGQGVARLYPNPLRRQSGDIDLWVRGKRDEVIKAFKSFSPLTEVCNHHAHCSIFPDTVVEIHFMPSWMYDPLTDRRLQRFFERNEKEQFSNYNEALGVNVTTVSFDLVFSAVHIYRHLFTEGIGLRQLLDYYYILSHSTPEQRAEAYQTLSTLRMAGFAQALMWVLGQVFSLPAELMLAVPDKKVGEFLLEEIMLSGNFGKYDTRITWHGKGLFRVFLNRVKRNFRFLKYFPSEVLWAPVWKILHFVWRKVKGFD